MDDRSLVVELWKVPVPLAHPVVTPAGTFATYHHLVVRALDVEGADVVAGWGLAAGVTADEVDRCAERALALLDATGGGTAGLVAVEQVEDRSTVTPHDRWSRWAACALATAGWDLRARREDVACADLWGRRPGTASLPAYASGFFLSTDVEGLDAEARRYRAAGFRTVKVRTGLPLAEDLGRLEVVRRHFPDADAVAVDAVEAWDLDAALAFVDAAGPLRWIEDPVPYDQLPALTSRLGAGAPPVAAGEPLTDLDQLVALRSVAGVDAVLLDVQQVGGPQRFLTAAARLVPLGARIGAHVFTPVSAHLLACVADPLPVEVFDWSDPLWTTPPAPTAEGHLPVTGPGLGIDLDPEVLPQLGTLLHTAER